ncbi:MAG: CBS domain-containing protein [Planctomycetota bacterium]|jgi:CBS domain-containing protein
MRVRDLLTDYPVACLPPTATAYEAAMTMTRGRQGSVLVVQDDKLLGIFTERDLMTRVVAKGLGTDQVQLEQVMSSDLYTANPEDSVTDVRREMRTRHIRHVPVVDSDKIIAVLSMRDLLRADLQETRIAAREMENYIRGDLG